MKAIFRFIIAVLLLPYVLAIVYIWWPPSSTLMLSRIANREKVERAWVPLSAISPNLIAAVVSSEDSAFCNHFGFDFNSIEKAMEKSKATGKPLRGASTISQQTAKNLFLWNDRSWIRKAMEVPLTLWIELLWPKKRILEVYLNVAEWGESTFGAETAAKRYFGTHARNLSLHQAALLAGSLPNPQRRAASSPGFGQVMNSMAIEQRVLKRRPDLSCLK